MCSQLIYSSDKSSLCVQRDCLLELGDGEKQSVEGGKLGGKDLWDPLEIRSGETAPIVCCRSGEES